MQYCMRARLRILFCSPAPHRVLPPTTAGNKAQTKDGVLTLTVPKTEESKPKSIDISVE